ncbi:NBS-LRR resistance protein, partial [Trifolium medium]|nr:NBS-LRR resistance protein [Trifolium medium]
MELSNEPFNLALEHLCINRCAELESLPEQLCEGLCSLRTIDIVQCEGLRSLPEGIRQLTSLGVLTIRGCSTLKKRCEEQTGEDWDKIAHIPKLLICCLFLLPILLISPNLNMTLSLLVTITQKAEKLSTTLEQIKVVLEDAEKKQDTNDSIK